MAAPTSCNIKGAFNDAKYSDVTIKFESREIRCHKVVLAQASEYFSTLLDPDKPFSEGKQAIVELKEDDPDAVELMLRHIYDMPYNAVREDMKLQSCLKLHMDVCIAARKYQLPVLEQAARNQVLQCTPRLGYNFATNNNTSEMIEFFHFCSDYKDANPDLRSIMTKISKRNLPKLLAVPEFRSLLDKEEHKDILDLVVEAVEFGQKMEESKQCKMLTCPRCGLISSGNYRKCVRCGLENEGDRTLDNWRKD